MSVYLPTENSLVQQLAERWTRPPRILLVEDEEEVADLFGKRLLKIYDFQLTTCYDGETAIQLIRQTQEPFDLVFLNLRLPRANGVEVLRFIKAKWLNVPVVILTGWSDSDLARQAMQLGVISVFQKPMDDKSFEEILNFFKVRPIKKDTQKLVTFTDKP